MQPAIPCDTDYGPVAARRYSSAPWESNCHFLHFAIPSRDTSDVVAICMNESKTAEIALVDDAPHELTEQRIVVLDFGSQYAQLIARRVREQNVYCQILRHDITAERLAELAPKGIILSGGPVERVRRRGTAM